MDAALEMEQSPNVAIMYVHYQSGSFAPRFQLIASQHASGVMQVANHFFENAMTFFTSVLQVSISLMVSNGGRTSLFTLLGTRLDLTRSCPVRRAQRFPPLVSGAGMFPDRPRRWCLASLVRIARFGGFPTGLESPVEWVDASMGIVFESSVSRGSESFGD